MTPHYSESSKDDKKIIIEEINNLNTPFNFSPDKVKVMTGPLLFSNGWTLVLCENYEVVPFQSYYFIHDEGGRYYALSYTPNPYQDNDFSKLNIQIKDDTVEQYLFFYFQFLQAKFGRIKPIRQVDDIQWKDDLPLVSRQSLEKEIKSYPKITANDIGYNVILSCLYQNALISLELNLTNDGYVTIQRIKTLIDDLPVINFA